MGIANEGDQAAQPHQNFMLLQSIERGIEFAHRPLELLFGNGMKCIFVTPRQFFGEILEIFAPLLFGQVARVVSRMQEEWNRGTKQEYQRGFERRFFKHALMLTKYDAFRKNILES